MNVLYDHQIFTMQARGGISRYFAELMSELSNLDDIEIYTSFKFSNNKHLLTLKSPKHYSFFSRGVFRKKIQIQKYLNQYYARTFLNAENVDIFHPTYYAPLFFPQLKKKRLVVTVYDMTHEKLPGFFPDRDKVTEYKKKIVDRADRVITISNQTRNDLVEIFGVDEKKINVVYLGNSLNIRIKPQGIRKGLLPTKYILYVGWRGKYKNFEKFVESISPIIREDDDLHLVCVGGGSFNRSEKEFLSEKGVLKKSLQISCNDQELMQIYRNARCFVFPSLYEGFGLPLLEAFSANCPVVCSNAGSLPEIASDAAVYFDPKSENEIRESVSRTIYDNTLRQSLIKEGAERGTMFSWKETARQTKKIYESLI